MRPSSISALVEDYLAVRRSLGFVVKTQGHLLRMFGRFADDCGHRGPLTVELAVRWASSSGSKDPANAARRLSVVRGFAAHLVAFDPATEVPDAGLLGPRTRRKPPHIYTDAEIATLLRAFAALRPRGALRPRTYVTLASLLLSTGLRISEARELRRDDVDLDAGILTIRRGKFRKSRLVPLHPSALAPLRSYAAFRDARELPPRSEFFFRTDRAPFLTWQATNATIWKLRRRLRWTAAGRTRLPRYHDMRHTFAVRRLVRWHEEGVDVDRRMLHLSTYLGHAEVPSTYWYLTAVPELMALAGERFEQFANRERERAS
jgi:integrase